MPDRRSSARPVNYTVERIIACSEPAVMAENQPRRHAQMAQLAG